MKKGIVYNLIARLLFIVGAYVLHVSLARLLGLYYYGVFGVVLSVLMVCYVFLNNGVRQAVSGLTAIYPESAVPILRVGLKYQVLIGIIVSLILIALNPVLVVFFNDPELSMPLYIVAALVSIQGIYFIFAGTLNGMRHFLNESIMMSIYAVTRTIATISIVYIGFNVNGAISGFLIASVLSIVIGWLFCRGYGRKHIDLSKDNFFSIAWQTMVFFGSVTLIMNIDLLAVKHYLINERDVAGLYTAAGALSKPGYFVLFAFGTIGMPVLTQKFARGEIHSIRETISSIVTYSICLVAPGIIILQAIGSQLIEILFKTDYLPAARPFEILVIGIFFLGLASIFAHCLIAIRRERSMGLIAVVTGVLCITMNALLVPNYGMTGAAISTAATSFFMALSSGTIVALSVGSFIKPFSLLKWIVVLGTIWTVAGFIKGGVVTIVAYSLILYLVGCSAFIYLKEMQLEDLIGTFRAD